MKELILMSAVASILFSAGVRSQSPAQVPSSQALVGSTVWFEIEVTNPDIDVSGNPYPPIPANTVLAIDLFDSSMPKTVNSFKKICDPTYIQECK
jgi:hypothetical protein